MRQMLIGLMILTLAGCSSPDKQDGDNNGWEFNSDAGDAGGGDTGPPPGDTGGEDMKPDVGPPPGAVTFRLINESDMPVFAYRAAGAFAPCGVGTFVEVLENGQSQRIKDDCSVCDCDAEDCAICAFDCAPGADPEYAQIGDGQVRSFTWDGLIREERPDGDGGICLADRAPSSDTLTARFCWGHGFETTFDPWGEITDIECQEVEFSVGDQFVEFTIGPSAREQVAFELTNGTDQMLYAPVGVSSPCEVSEWLRLSQDGNAMQLSPPCGPCLCGEVDGDQMCPLPCPAIACAPPSPDLYEFPPGATRSYHWNRVEYVDDMVDGTSCLQDMLVTGEVTAELCWGDGFDDASYAITGEQCETIVFDPYQDSTVFHTITAAP